MYPFANGRYINHLAFHEALEGYWERSLLCTTSNNNQVFTYSWGDGPTKILIWSQMHGNEPSGTFALWNLMKRLKATEMDALKQQISLIIIPILNPDGTEAFTRFNAQGIDLNRDAKRKSSPEMSAFFELIEKENPSWAFNLHDQRNIFNVKGSSKPASIAVLSPSVDKERTLNPIREDVMKLVAAIKPQLSKHVGDQLSRFSDEFYPRATGDIMQSMGIRTLLIESGACPNDPMRNLAVEMNELILEKAFTHIAKATYEDADIAEYLNIVENDNKLFDLLLRNVTYKGLVCDIGFLYSEELVAHTELKSTLLVSDIGDLDEYFGLKELDFQESVLPGSFERGKAPESSHPIFNES